MGRPISKLSRTYRVRLRRLADAAEDANAELLAEVRAGIDAGEPHAAIARELGISPALFWTRYQDPKRTQLPTRRDVPRADA